jgi:hypothetical protein
MRGAPSPRPQHDHIMPSRIVTSTYRYKRPPRKRKAVPLQGPAIVSTKSSRRPVWEKAAAEVLHAPCSGGAVQPSTPREVERVIAQPPANDDRKPAMATKPTLVTTTCSPATDSGRSHGRYKRRQAGGIGSGCRSVAGHSDLGGWRGAEGYVPRQRVRAGMAGMAITTTGRSYGSESEGLHTPVTPL